VVLLPEHPGLEVEYTRIGAATRLSQAQLQLPDISYSWLDRCLNPAQARASRYAVIINRLNIHNDGIARHAGEIGDTNLRQHAVAFVRGLESRLKYVQPGQHEHREAENE